MNPQLTRTLEKLAEPPPQVAPQQQKRSGFIPWLILIALLGAGGYAAWKYWQPIKAYFTAPMDATAGGGRRGAAGGIIPVVAATARLGVVHIYLDGLGQVTPLATVSLKTRVDGQIMKINYDEGQLVHEGDLLMEIDPRPYQVQLEQANGQMGKDQAYLNNAKLDLTRYQEAGSAVSDQQLATQQSLVDQYDATVKSDQSQIDAAQLQLKYCEVTSPITGRIGLRQVDVGNIVHAADTTSVAVITQLQPITVVFALPEDDLTQVVGAPNGGVHLPVQAYDREDQHLVASGEVSAVDNQVDPTTGTFKVKATFANQDSSLFPSEFVNAHLLADTKRNRILIPTAAVQHGPAGGAFVWLVKSDQTVTLANVTESDGEQDFESVTGIQPGDIVVTDGTDKLQEGTKVTATMTDFGTSTTGPTTRVGRGGRRSGQVIHAEEYRAVSPSRPFILRPVATSLLMAGILLVGIFAYKQLPVSALPEVDYPTIQVSTFLPGASPDVMASSVTAPLERQFGQVPGLNQMTSTSSQGSSSITLQFSLDLNIDVAEQEVQAAINAAGTYLPKTLPNPPIYSKINPADTPILTLALTSKSLPLTKVEDLADTRLAQKIAQLPGVGLVSISGGQKPAVRVQVNPTALGSLGLTMENIRSVIAGANVNEAKGSFDGTNQAHTIGANDQLLTSADYKPLIVTYRNGAAVKLSDVANVVDDAENIQEAAWMNNDPAVIVNIQRQPGANIIQVADRIKALLPQLQTALPASVNVAILTDRTVTIRASVSDVEFEMMLTIGLVVMVMFLFLRSIAATIIPSVAVPLSIVGTFGVMYLLGYSLDNLSLMALTVSTGFVVDDAIVMIENVSRFIEEGKSPLEAALMGSEQIGFTIISLSVSLIAALIPLLFMGDVVGRLFREFAVTLSVTIVVSAIVSLTLTPMMCKLLLHYKPESEQGWFYRASEHVFDAVIELYGKTLAFVLRHQTTTLLVFVATLGLTGYLFYTIPKGFFPVQDTGEILGVTQAPQDISFGAMADRQQQAATVILQDPAVESLSSFIGVDGTNTTVNSGRIQINLKPLEERKINSSDIIRRLQPKLDAVAGITLYMQPVQDLAVEDRVSRTQYQLTLEDPDPTELADWTPKMVSAMEAIATVRDVATDQQNSGLNTQLVIDRDTSSRLGITPQVIDDTLYDAFGQRQVSTMFTQLNQYHVVLEVAPQFQTKPKDLKDIYIMSASGGQVPLSAFTTMVQQATPLAVNHQGQFPCVTISFNLAPEASLGDAVKAIEAAQQNLGMPPSIQVAFQGTAAAFESSLSNEPVLIAAALITVYIVLGILYESYVHPITILSTLPSAGVGAVLALLLCKNDFSVIALIGLILLIGIVKKNGIMMVDFALEAERKEGKSPHQAIFQACMLRFRPIMMTTMAALFGGLPLAMGSGVGSELRRPLGIAIVGGLIFSQALTLYTTPVIYLWFDRLAMRMRGTAEPEAAAALPGLEGA